MHNPGDGTEKKDAANIEDGASRADEGYGGARSPHHAGYRG
jgi:hypothetical protein